MSVWLSVRPASYYWPSALHIRSLARFHPLNVVWNVDFRLGPLNWVFSMAELHRFHHSALARESDSNYGGTLIIWDIIFDTRFLPRGRKGPEQTGNREEVLSRLPSQNR